MDPPTSTLGEAVVLVGGALFLGGLWVLHPAAAVAGLGLIVAAAGGEL